MEALACAQMPPAARGISAVLCPPGTSGELEFVAMGGEDTGVYIWDVSRPGRPPLVVNKLQVWSHTGCMRQATCVVVACHMQLSCVARNTSRRRSRQAIQHRRCLASDHPPLVVSKTQNAGLARTGLANTGSACTLCAYIAPLHLYSGRHRYSLCPSAQEIHHSSHVLGMQGHVALW